MSDTSTIAPLLLNLSDQALDPKAKELIRAWQPTPLALEILRTLDLCVHGSLCDGFTIKVLEILLNEACDKEGTTYEEVVGKATWRHQKPYSLRKRGGHTPFPKPKEARGGYSMTHPPLPLNPRAP